MDSVLYLSLSSTYQTALLAHLFGVWLVMQQLSLSFSHPSSASLHILFTFSLSLSLARTCTETQFLPQGWMLDINMDRMCKDFPSRGLFDVLIYTYVCGVGVAL